MQSDVLVTNAENRASLAITRSLGSKNIDVQLCGNHSKCPAFFSRYAKSYFSNTLNHDKMKKSILRRVHEQKPSVFIPVVDNCLRFVYSNIDKIEKDTQLIPLVDYDKYLEFQDKENIVRFAQKRKITTPFTNVCGPEDVISKAKEIGFPLIIKPSVGSGARGVSLVRNKTSLKTCIKSIKRPKNTCFYNSNRIILQEYIKSPVLNYNVFMQEKKIVARDQTILIKTMPPECGSMARGLSLCSKTFDKVGHDVAKKTRVKNGVMNMQFIKDNHEYKLLEINPRIWGGIQSSITSGVDYPYLLYKAAKGIKIRSNMIYRKNLELRFVRDDFRSSIESKSTRGLLSACAPIYCKTDVVLKDPLPHLVELMNDTYDLLRQ